MTLLLKEQYGYLNGFAREIAAGNLSAKQILWRAGLYPMGGRQSYWKARDADEKKRGLTQERRITERVEVLSDDSARVSLKNGQQFTVAVVHGKLRAKRQDASE